VQRGVLAAQQLRLQRGLARRALRCRLMPMQRVTRIAHADEQ
jgi:hypothetical protein